MSKTAMAAGAAAVAAGAAAVAAKRGGSDEDSSGSPARDEVVTPVTPVAEEDTFVSEPVVTEAVIVEEDPYTDPRANI